MIEEHCCYHPVLLLSSGNLSSMAPRSTRRAADSNLQNGRSADKDAAYINGLEGFEVWQGVASLIHGFNHY